MKKCRVGINGYGRIGRSVFRIIEERSDVEVVAINDITDNRTLAYLTKFDTVMGTLPGDVRIDGNTLRTDHQSCAMYEERDPAKIPWAKHEVDIVVESTGVFRERAQVEKHVQAGARKVILTVPPKDALDAMIVMGVNDEALKPEHRLVSNASCTTNCLAPMAKVLHENFGIEWGMMTTVHAYTNDQRLSDFYHKDFRRARAANENIIPTTTGAARSVGKVIPELAGKLDGLSLRVPVPVGSTVDFVAITKKAATVDAVNRSMKEAAVQKLKGILRYSTDPLVSSDIIGDPHSSIFDAPLTRVLRDNMIKVVSWYDNEWGYSNRVVDLIVKLASN